LRQMVRDCGIPRGRWAARGDLVLVDFVKWKGAEMW